jgi:hypothetical protein
VDGRCGLDQCAKSFCGTGARSGCSWCHEADVRGERREVMPMKPERPGRGFVRMKGLRGKLFPVLAVAGG